MVFPHNTFKSKQNERNFVVYHKSNMRFHLKKSPVPCISALCGIKQLHF